jgi:hypothetical protein
MIAHRPERFPEDVRARIQVCRTKRGAFLKIAPILVLSAPARLSSTGDAGADLIAWKGRSGTLRPLEAITNSASWRQ